MGAPPIYGSLFKLPQELKQIARFDTGKGCPLMA